MSNLPPSSSRSSRRLLRLLNQTRFTTPLVLLSFASSLASAATGNWIGSANATWDTSATNWTGVTNPAWDATNGAANLALFATANSTLIISGGVFTNGLTFNGTTTITGTANASLTLAGTTAITTNTNASSSIAAQLSGTSGLTKAGTTTLTLTGLANYTGNTTINNGALTIAEAGTLTGGGNLALSTATAITVFNYNSTGNSTVGAISVATGSSRNAFIGQTAGTLNATSLTLGNGANSGGIYNLSGGSLVLSGSAEVGKRAGPNWISQFNVSGNASVTATAMTIAANSFSNGDSGGHFQVTGGNVTLTNSLVLGGTDTGRHNAYATLSGGTTTVASIIQGSNQANTNSQLYLNGGVLRPKADTLTFINGIDGAYVYGGGAVIDTNGFNVTVPQVLSGTSGTGVRSITGNYGSGYGSNSTFTVTFQTPAGGRPATGYASSNATGVITAITIADQGTGYAGTGNLTFTGGTGTNPGAIPVTYGLPNLSGTAIAATGGGLTKLGNGTLTLTGNNTYTGATVVEAGTLALTTGNQLSDSAALSVASAALVQLDFAGNDSVGSLSLGGVYQPAGVWGALGSGAANESALITSTGLINNSNSAGQFYWDGGGANWGNVSAWSFDPNSLTHDPAVIPDASSVLNFGVTPLVAAQNVDLAADRAVRGLVFRSPATFAIVGGGTNRVLTLGTSGVIANLEAGDVTIGSATSGQQVSVSLSGLQTWSNNGVAALTFANGVNLGTQTLTFSGSGPITIGGGLSAGTGGTFAKIGNGTLTLSGADTLASDKTIDNGTIAITGNHSAAAGGWLLRGYGASGTTFNTAATTLSIGATGIVSVPSGKAIQAGASAASGNFELQTIQSSGTVTNAGTLFVGRSGRLTLSGGQWTQSANATVKSLGGGMAAMTVANGATFTYGSATPFDLTASGSPNVATNLTLDAGTLITGVGFNSTEVTAPVGTSAGLVFANNGELRLGAPVANLLTSAGSTLHFILNAGGGVVNTNGFSTTLNVPITGAGGLIKSGNGTFTTTAANSYTGNTTVTGGTLSLASATLDDASTISVSSGASLALNFAGTDTVTALFINGVQKTAGLYTAANSSGALAGIGSLNVTSSPVVTDTTPPLITLTGSASVAVNWGSSYSDAGATATDNVDPSVTVNSSGTVNTAKPGVYTIAYNATDIAGNPASANRTVTVSIANATTVGVDGYSPLLRYALGANSPTDTVQAPVTSATATTLSLTAVVRIDDTALTVGAEAVNNLTDTWGTGGTITVTDAADQSGVSVGVTKRKVFTVDTTGASKKFLRLKATLAP